MNDKLFEENLNPLEKEAWNQFCLVVKNFLGNCKSSPYASIFLVFFLLLEKSWGKNVTQNFLHSHLDFFPPDMGEISNERGERFHQELSPRRFNLLV